MHDAHVVEDLVSALQLDMPPIGVAFVAEPPAGVPMADRDAPSACTFWRRAEQGVFYAPAGAHFNCAVGAVVMGFELPEDKQRELMSLVEGMVGCGYLQADEAARIPSVPGRPAGIVYGPLADMPVPADVVVLWLSPRQAMLWAEAAGSCAWTEAPSPSSRLLGRPACAALPMALSSDTATVSLGCAGMRTFTEISQDRLLATVPGKSLPDAAAALGRTMEANAAMQRFYDERKALFAGA
jgi:uncharacterized protein (DUF169 family)